MHRWAVVASTTRSPSQPRCDPPLRAPCRSTSLARVRQVCPRPGYPVGTAGVETCRSVRLPRPLDASPVQRLCPSVEELLARPDRHGKEGVAGSSSAGATESRRVPSDHTSEALPGDLRVAACALPDAVNEDGLASDLSRRACVAPELGTWRAVGVAHEGACLVAADAGRSDIGGDVIAVGGERDVPACGDLRACRPVATASGQDQEHADEQRRRPATRHAGSSSGRGRRARRTGHGTRRRLKTSCRMPRISPARS